VNLESFVDTYRYWAITVGTFFEGKTIVVLEGFTALRGYLALPWVIASASWGASAATSSSSTWGAG
jgi:membrane protein DedA with SNARE-associated domain